MDKLQVRPAVPPKALHRFNVNFIGNWSVLLLQLQLFTNSELLAIWWREDVL
jgi:hypothetical protein